MRMQKMKSAMDKKSELDKRYAVKKYEATQRKVHKKIYDTMSKRLPESMRSVI